jgi:hypothetical protein
MDSKPSMESMKTNPTFGLIAEAIFSSDRVYTGPLLSEGLIRNVVRDFFAAWGKSKIWDRGEFWVQYMIDKFGAKKESAYKYTISLYSSLSPFIDSHDEMN